MVLRDLLEAGDGLVTRRQLREAGLGQRWVHRRVPMGLLIPVLPGVLRWSQVAEDLHLRIRAGLLQAGPDSALTHLTALWNWGFDDVPPTSVHVCIPRGRAGRIGWLQIHVQSKREVVTWNGLPTVVPADAVAAAAADVHLDDLRFPTMAAAKANRLTPEELVARRRRNELGALRILAEEVAAGAESGGEAIYWRLLHDSHLPTPVLQHWVMTDQGPKRLDAYWEELLLAAEIDGREHHAKEEAFEPDTRRQNSVHATGILVIRYSVATVRYDRGYVLEDTEANMEARRALLRGRHPRG